MNYTGFILQSIVYNFYIFNVSTLQFFSISPNRAFCAITTHVWFFVFFGKWGSGGCNRGEQLSYVQKSILTKKDLGK